MVCMCVRAMGIVCVRMMCFHDGEFDISMVYICVRTVCMCARMVYICVLAWCVYVY